MKTLRTLLFTLITTATLLAAPSTHAQSQTQQTQTQDIRAGEQSAKERKRAARERRIAERATKSTELKVREGKTPRYSALLKSTSYQLMFREGLRYYNMTKKNSDRNSIYNYRRAQSLFYTAISSQTFAGVPQEDSIYYYYGCSFYMAQDFQTSQDIFDNFRRRYGASPFTEDADYKFAMGFYFLSPEPQHDQSVTIRAMSAITEYLGRYPETTHREVCDERMGELQRKLHTKTYENAKLYYNIGQYKAAVRALNNAIDLYPDSPFREELMYLATRSAYLFARNSVQGQMTDRYMAMMDNYYNLVSEFPETKHLREVEQMRDEARAYIDIRTSDDATAEENDTPAATTTPAMPAVPTTITTN
ncbi:MAG: outer membrane protein assembly factor BamD [Alistipes sp.]|jgi:outer membrane protein assembly factor BamD|nr:outer membrane protein assembly factor BamD [Alistipes sp.]